MMVMAGNFSHGQFDGFEMASALRQVKVCPTPQQ